MRDDGKGIDPAVLASQGLEGHYGLRGMPERAALIGGKLAVWSEVGAGTEVELRLPASIVVRDIPAALLVVTAVGLEDAGRPGMTIRRTARWTTICLALSVVAALQCTPAVAQDASVSLGIRTPVVNGPRQPSQGTHHR